jgi:hypothetical protein
MKTSSFVKLLPLLILSIVALAGSLTVNNLAAFAQNISNTNQISSSSSNICCFSKDSEDGME